MSTLQYVGRDPDSDFSVSAKKYVDTRYDAVKADSVYIDSQVAVVATDLVNPAYVDGQDNLRATKAAVDAADAAYVPVTDRGAANGVAPIGSDGYVPLVNLPALQTERKPVIKNVDTVFLSGTRTVTTVNAKEFQVASLTIPDPGFPYYPLCFAVIQGGALSAPTQPLRSMGTNNYGQASILATDNTKYGWAICGSMKTYDFYTVLPFADNTINPTTRPMVTGPLTLGLWVGLWGGTTFTFNSTGLQFYTIAMPGY